MLGNVQVLSASFPVSPVRDGVRLVVHDRHRERSQPRRGADVHSGRNQPVLRGVVWRVCRETSVCLHERLRFRERETKVSKGEVRERAYCFLAAGFMFGLSFAKTLKQVYGFGILMTVCVSGAYASVDGILVCAAKGENTKMKEGREEEMRRIGDQNTTEGEDALEEEGENNNTSRRTKNRRITQVNVQTVAMATRTFAAILGSYSSVLFLEMFTARATIALSSVFAILAAFIALKIEERSNGGVEEGTDVDLEMRRRRSTTTTTTTTIITTIKSKKWPWRRFFSRSRIHRDRFGVIHLSNHTNRHGYVQFLRILHLRRKTSEQCVRYVSILLQRAAEKAARLRFPSSTTNI